MFSARRSVVILSETVIPFSNWINSIREPGRITARKTFGAEGWTVNLPDEVTDLYVCCSKGMSRSAAVAAALLRMSGRSDDPVWLNPYYVPNILVYYVLCKEAGIPITPDQVLFKQKQNEEAYKKLQQGVPCEYERWQILE